MLQYTQSQMPMKKVVFEPDTYILMHCIGLRVVSQRKNEQIAIPPPTFGWFLWSWIFWVFCDFSAMKSHFIGSLCNWIVSQSCFKIQMNSYIQHVLNNWLWVMINSFPKQHVLYQFHIQAATLILRWTTQIKELLAEAGLFQYHVLSRKLGWKNHNSVACFFIGMMSRHWHTVT